MLLKKFLASVLIVSTVFNPVLAATSPNIIRLGSDTLSDEPAANWVAADPSYTDWESGTPYDCSGWEPDPAVYTEDIVFTQQSTSCSVDQTRQRQEREQDTYSLAYRDVGMPTTEEMTLVNQSAERDYRIQYADWASSADPYNCSNWSPAESSYPSGISFTQIADDCQLDQSRTRTESSRFSSGSWVQEALTSENRTLNNQAHARSAFGTAQTPGITFVGPTGEVFVASAFNLSWTAVNQTQLWISSSAATSGVGVTPVAATGTGQSVTPSAIGSFTYTLKAENDAGQSDQKSVAVTVVDTPKVLTFGSDKTQVALNADFTLSWTDSGAGTLSLDNGVGTVSGVSKVINAGSVAGSKTYTLTSTRTLNGVTKQDSKTVTVDVLNNATASFTTAPSTNVFANAPFTLAWSATGATNYKIKSNNAASGISVSDSDLGTATTTSITPTAAGNYTYTLTTTNAAGATTTTSKTITVEANPTISAFTASPTTVTVGGNTTLAWTTTGDILSINQSVGTVTGSSTSVAVGSTAGSKTYTLTSSKTLNGVTRSATATATVTIVSAPTVSFSTAPSTNVFANAAFTLGWTATGATNYEIKGSAAASGLTTTNVDLDTATSTSITPTAAGTYTYTLTATNAAGTTTTITKSITVEANPAISAFTASPTTVTVGGNTTLAWTTTGDTLSINQSVGTVTGSSTSVAVGSTAGSKTYTLTSSKTLNGVTRSATSTATVTIVAAPTVTIGTAPSTSVFINAAFTLGWSGTGASDYTIKGSAAASGVSTTEVSKGTATSHSITPTAAGTYTYTIKASNSAGSSVTATKTIVVEANPNISSFSASPTAVQAGNTTRLTWAQTGANSLSIDQSVGTVSGTYVDVNVGSTGGTKTYTLTASKTLNGVSRSDTATASVTVSTLDCRYSASAPISYWNETYNPLPSPIYSLVFNGTTITSGSGWPTGPITIGGYTYSKGSLMASSGSSASPGTYKRYQICRQ